MAVVVKITGGFAEVEAGLWFMGHGQPAAFFGKAVHRRRKGWCVRDRAKLELVETTASAKCADSLRPFLTHIPCAVSVFAVSGKVLVAPAGARKDAKLVKVIPMSARNALCVTEFGPSEEGGHVSRRDVVAPREDSSSWVVMATAGRTARVALEADQTISVRPEAVVAWTGKRPTGFCPKLSFWDMILPREVHNLLFTFYGPGIVWFEGSFAGKFPTHNFQIPTARRAYGV